MTRTLTRRHLLAGATAGALVYGARPRRAWAGGDVEVPVDIQAKLVAKIAAFDRNMPTRAEGEVHVVVPRVEGDPESVRTAKQLALNLLQLGRIVDRPVAVTVTEFESGAALAAKCKAVQASMLYLTPGLRSDLTNIAAAFEGRSILSVSAVPDHIYEGAAVSFRLTEGKPKILVHLGRAQAQGVNFKASFLRLAEVVDL